MNFFVFGIITTGIYLNLYIVYMLFLLIVNLLIRDKCKLASSPETRFGIIIPAHNEEIFLPRLLRSLDEQDYPSELFDIMVIADNCSDMTTKVASPFNPIILERKDSRRIGKGYAIKFALDNMDIYLYDAIVIIDADSMVQSDALGHLDQDIKEGKKIIQCYNGVANPDDSWFTRLMDVSRTIGNEIYEPAKEKLRLSSHLMGNGMCFHKDVILKYGWDSFSVGEDWEYYAKVIREGERVAFAKDVRVYHQESSSIKQATSQRMRWSSGRFAIALRYGIGLFFHGLIEGKIRKMDASLPLILPNPSLAINLSIILFAVSFLLSNVEIKQCLTIWIFIMIVIQIGFFCIGILYTKNKFGKFLSIFIAPVFLAWKMGIDSIAALGFGRKKWVRTLRKPRRD